MWGHHRHGLVNLSVVDVVDQGQDMRFPSTDSITFCLTEPTGRTDQDVIAVTGHGQAARLEVKEQQDRL
jgi:hypothetical protein